MGVLRDILRENIPSLHSALERSWTIALDEWIPALGVQLGSFNSFPHLRNLERHLDRIVTAHGQSADANGRALLSPIEIYVMLSAILFHDIGRAIPSADHGEQSKSIITAKRAELGIPSGPLANCIGGVCAFHTLSPTKQAVRLPRLMTISIDPYGEIRQSCCAALLTLVDHLDMTFSRALPTYIWSADNTGIVGSFRRRISDVVVDLPAAMVKIVLAPELGQQPDKGNSPRLKYDIDTPQFNPSRCTIDEGGKLCFSLPDKDEERTAEYEYMQLAILAAQEQKEKETPATVEGAEPEKKIVVLLEKRPLPPDGKLNGELRKVISGEKNIFKKVTKSDPHGSSLFNRERFSLVARGYMRAELTQAKLNMSNALRQGDAKAKTQPLPSFFEIGSNLLSDLNKQFRSTTFDDLAPVYTLVLKKLSDLNGAKFNTSAPREWPPELLLATILADTKENVEAISTIRGTLAAMGLPIHKWLIEYDEHLYDEFGNETIEPIFACEYLTRVAEAMWRLSNGVFAQTAFSYEVLAAELRDAKVERVKRAARRINILATSDQGESPLWLGLSQWRWNVHDLQNGRCNAPVPLGAVETAIEAIRKVAEED